MNRSSSSSSSNNPNKMKIIGGYKMEERLGSGSFATVYKGTLLNINESPSKTSSKSKKKSAIVAIKAISKTSSKVTPKLLENLEMEITMLSTFKHINIVCMEDVEKTPKTIYLILEYCGGGDLQHLIRSREKGRLSEGLTRRLVKDLTKGLRYLWGREVIHRDIKPQNLLLTGCLPLDEMHDICKDGMKETNRQRTNFPTDKFFLKIADFGFARHLSTSSLAETLCGSPLYMAPEILQHHRYDAKADLWSVGAVVFEMLAGHPPFTGQNHMDLLRNIQRKAVKLPRGVVVSNEAVGLLKVLLNRNPLSRAGFDLFFERAEEFISLGCNPKLQRDAFSDEQVQPPPPSHIEPSLNHLLPNTTQPMIKTQPPSFIAPVSPSPPISLYANNSPIPSIPEQPEESDFVMVPSSSMIQTLRCANKQHPSNHSLLSTSPNTGAALLKAINSKHYNPNDVTTAGCSPQDYSKILAAAQDVGRRAVNIAHVGDTRAFLAMSLIQQQVIDPFMPLHTLTEVDHEDDDMPFVLNDGPSPHPSTNETITPNNKNNILIHQYLQEALSCYLKALSLLKSALKASQLSQHDPLTLSYLTSQFQQVLERADAANTQMNKLPPVSSTPPIQSPEQLIYYHALAAGKHGAVKQLLGQNDAAKESYHTAALLTESLLMDTSKYPLKDTILLQEYVTAFSTRIREIDDLPNASENNNNNDTLKPNSTKHTSGLFESLIPPLPFVNIKNNRLT